MSTQTEAEMSIAGIIRKHAKDISAPPEVFDKISIQIIICDGGEKIMVVKVPRSILHGVQMNYSNIIKAAKQQFHDYYIMFVRNFEAEGGGKTMTKRKAKEVEEVWLANACFPFLLTGTRTDVRGVDDMVVNVLLERRTSLSRAEMDAIGAALHGLLGKNYIVDVNHHTKN
ncbi:40S RIBOSOMAL PROTEIN S7 [Encephalitozoon cuniculi GB-M1]|uniref:Small ribosomal subunit protein eS7 n=2 Tax=Encephalitozoon cuniculi TaxID=6035 RepID=RS7_ENCCU|nr:uncharacterized protein ECU11_0780 [Encephalitozoon cuniculi GB-M1]Q8SQX3.2 RecName: Full=Small ribosomal subunit protein eS7; AltName: Full=40S ribosomal protein S7 [Encephalitozoon cuniculi GB-M1]7QEP_S7 Chain S7, 40S ribosomal protein S7 [Encephalitozoon cuniculi GB-M1]KMV65036.1 hypothetical protein M970_110770 [Encephalitozoon cuniculi EcunIII-L]UYI26281.1 ribosomal protein S7 [Encephalitozoon cuniculi]CAD25988.2 40S RIBOSOMAL PROTEIN S7 [Encephalitozoon cuniculi GB-M1]